jgi:hypothetical protein
MTTLTLDRVREGVKLGALTWSERRWLKVWTLAHLALIVLIYQLDSMNHRTFDQTVQAWDGNLLQNIAQHGYLHADSSANTIAFFPGYPILLNLTHDLTAGNWVVAELLISYVAGAVALIGLCRLHPLAPRFILMSPAAIFLLVAYSEAPYLALAVWAWIYCQRKSYLTAGLLAMGAALIRVDGVFLMVALLVMGRNWRLLVGFVSPMSYLLYLHTRTGSWLAWSHAETVGWGRHTQSPISTWRASWSYAGGAGGSYGAEEKIEIFCAIVMLLATIVFAVDRDWPAMIYCGITMMTLTTSTFYMSIPRAMLVVFPIWVRLARSRETVRWTWLSVSAPVMVMISFFYLTGQWAG